MLHLIVGQICDVACEPTTEVDENGARLLDTRYGIGIAETDYLSLLTDFGELTDSEIAAKRDVLINRCAEIYAAMPATDSKSYSEAQQALKSNEEQFFTQEELNKMLPQHLRKEEK